MPVKPTLQQQFAEEAVAKMTHQDFTCLSGTSKLSEACGNVAGKPLIPSLLQKCVEALKSKSAMKAGKKTFAVQAWNKPASSLAVGAAPSDAAAALKRWLKDLPEPIIPSNLHRLLKFCYISNMADEVFTLLLASMTEQYFQMCEYLFSFLSLICSEKSESGMTSEAIAILFGPCMWPPSSEDKDTGLQVSIIQKLIDLGPKLFIVPEGLLNLVTLKTAADESAKAFSNAHDMYMYHVLSTSLTSSGAKVQSKAEKTAAKKKMLKRFGLPASEEVHNEFPCRLQKALPVRGTLTVWQRYITFHGSLFGFDCIEVIPVKSITSLEKMNHTSGEIVRTDIKNAISVLTSEKDLCFFWNEDCKSKFSVLEDLWESQFFAGSTEENDDNTRGAIVGETLTEQEWSSFMSGIKVVTYSKNSNVIAEGKVSRNLYQIGTGTVRVVNTKIRAGEEMVLFRLESPDVFGEIEFLENSNVPAVAGVKANEDDTEIYVLERSFMTSLMQKHATFGLRFFKYLAILLAERLGKTATVEYHKDLAKQTKGAHTAAQSIQERNATSKAELNMKFAKYFEVDEEVIVDCPCYLQKSRPLFGHLFCSASVLGFYGTLFSFETLEAVAVSNIKSVQKKDDNVVITSSDGKSLSFHLLGSEANSVYDTLKAHVSHASKKNTPVGDLCVSQSIDSAIMDALLRGSDCISVKKGEKIITAGETSDSLYQLGYGEVRVEAKDGADLIILDHLKAGQMFGEMEFVHRSEHANIADCIADGVNEIKVYRASYLQMQKLIEAHPNFAVVFFRNVACELAHRLAGTSTVHTKEQ